MTYKLQAITYTPEGNLDAMQMVLADASLPLNRQFNCAVVRIAKLLLPGGWDVGPSGISDANDVIKHYDVPYTLAGLTKRANQTRRILVSGMNCEQTIYADASINHAFRAWRRWCHFMGEHEFDKAGNWKVFKMQAKHIRTLYGDNMQTTHMITILYAEVIGQFQYSEHHDGAFPINQRAFVEAWMVSAKHAVREDY